MNKSPLILAVAALLAVGAVSRAADVLPKPDQLIKIAGAKGKFDFLEVDTENHRLLAAHEKAGTADFIDLNNNTLIKRVETGPAVSICLDPKNGQYYISASEDKKVIIVDAKTLEKTGEIPTEGELDAILYEPKNGLVYVTNDESVHVWAIDPATNKVVATIDISGPPEYLLYDKSADRLYLALKKSNEVVSIDPNLNAIVAHWSTLPAISPHGLAFDPKTGNLFAAGQNGIVSEIDSKTGQNVGSAAIHKDVDQAVFDPSTNYIYCATLTGISVVKETKKGLKSIGTLEADKTARNCAVDPVTHSLWTTYTVGDDSFAASWKP